MKTIRVSTIPQSEFFGPGSSEYCKLYRLKRDVLAIASVNGKRTAVTLPKGAIIHITSVEVSDPRMLNISYKEERLVMFEIDLQERGEEIWKLRSQFDPYERLN